VEKSYSVANLELSLLFYLVATRCGRPGTSIRGVHIMKGRSVRALGSLGQANCFVK